MDAEELRRSQRRQRGGVSVGGKVEKVASPSSAALPHTALTAAMSGSQESDEEEEVSIGVTQCCMPHHHI